MKNHRRFFLGEDGFALVTSLLIMALVMVVGLLATQNSIVEMQIAGMDKFHHQAFSAGDSGIYVAPKLLARAIAEMETPKNQNFAAIDPGFYEAVMGYTPLPGPEDPMVPELELALAGNGHVGVDIQRTGALYLTGGGVEFGAGVEGPGSGSTVGVELLFRLFSQGTGPKNTTASILAEYRRIPGTSGGL